MNMDRRLAAVAMFAVMVLERGSSAPAEERPDFLLAGREPVRFQSDDAEIQYARWFQGVVAQDGNRAMISYNESKAKSDRHLAECKQRGWFFFAFPATDRSKRKEVIQVVAQGGKLRLIRDEPPRARLLVREVYRAPVYTEPPQQTTTFSLPLQLGQGYGRPAVMSPARVLGVPMQSGCPTGGCPTGG